MTSLRLLSCILFILPACVYAQGKEKNASEPLLIPRTADFDISGKGDAREWTKSEWVTLTRRKGAAQYDTRAKLLYSQTGIYVLFSCKDKKITSTFKEDFANLWTEDVVEIFLWPDQSESIYFEYELSPHNYELPILVPNFGGDFLGWRPWQYEGERKTRHAATIQRDAGGNPTEWLAEFFIPYALLKPLKNVPPSKGSEWRMNMYRVDHDQDHTSWSWKPVVTNFHDYERFGIIRFE